MLRFDGRTFIISLWATLGFGTLSTTYTFNYYANKYDQLPDQLSETFGIIAGLWGVALLISFLLGVVNEGSGLATLTNLLGGYWVGALIRIIFMKQFLPSTNTSFDLIWKALTLSSLPPYHTFLLLIFIGGSLTICLGLLLGLLIKSYTGYKQQIPVQNEPRALTLALVLPPLLLLLVVLLRSMRTGMEGAFLLTDADWFTQPEPNMIVGALVGALVGISYLSPDRRSAVSIMMQGMGVHVIMMLLLDSIFASYDPVYNGINPNQVPLGTFQAFWIFAPLVGAISAFAMHNLRDAFAMPSNLQPEVKS